jgi:diamine N-acetyltransferase
MEIDLRAAMLTDVDILCDLVSEYYASDGLVYDDELTRRALVELINHQGFGRIWVLELSQQPIGYLLLTFGFILEFHGRHAVIDEVYLRPNYRRRGYFQNALSFVEAFCRQMNLRCLRLEVENKNELARKSYEKAGFQKHDRLLMTRILA